jgi:hypothetical protein
MVIAPKPANEEARLKNLQSFEILDTENEKDYDGLVELVSLICQCPMAIVNFIDSNRQWFKASKNMSGKGGNRDESFCGHAIMNTDVFIVADATKDERFFDNPDVVGGLKVRFYAGAPIVSSNGYNLGTVCAIDKEPKYLSHSQVTALKTIAQQVSRLLDLRKKNKQILQAAELAVTTQKKVTQMNISERESENHQTALVLQDEINNAISAVKTYVEKARTNEAPREYLASSVDELNSLIEHVTTLSNTLAPANFTTENYQSHIEKLAKDFEKKEGASVHLNCNGLSANWAQEKGSMIFRILQDLLRFASQCASKTVSLTVKDEKGLEIVFEYDTNKFMLENQKVLLQDIMNRIEILGGQYKKNRFDSGETRIHINIPEAVK